ncbi:class I SAM-dependent methyltransferase [Haladaptatus sp. T7]|uniref:class I SAM-dependent methyltransferase n=1 Tax=Haladaptatus sp. T7 TaxID=2029368 RepID=UPI0021A2574A|nr:class I SAM-dependent methyltransferase [Haladaptatus sp. T7]GKZ13881.1 S-adenosylmethionine-dependent methyltransferase [Haladaptatus sp. T7]
MREFSADYLRRTRDGMWDSRDALADLDLDSRRRVLDVGCGTGELARVLADETPGEVVGTDADPRLLSVAAEFVPCVAGDAHRLPFPDDTFDLVVCQALLINLPDPIRAVREFARVSSDLVAAVEPDNSAVSVESTVPEERTLSRKARDAYVEGTTTDITLGGDGTREVFRTAGLDEITTRAHHHAKTVEPPYSTRDVEAAKRKATAGALADKRDTLVGPLSPDEYEDLRAGWRKMGHAVVDQMQTDDYRRAEVVPFYVTSGRV